MDEEWESWATLIRSTLISSKNALTLREINRDIKEIDGRNIPYKQMKYDCLEAMLKDIDGVEVYQFNGKTVVQARASEKSSHIQKMVMCQKMPKKRRTLSANTFFVKKQFCDSTRYQTAVNTKNVTNTRLQNNTPTNSNGYSNMSSKSGLKPKVTSIPTSVSQKPVQIQQQQQQHQQSAPSKTIVQPVPKFKMQPKLTPSEQLHAALWNHAVSDNESSQQLLSAKSQECTAIMETSSPKQSLISNPVVDPRIMLSNYCEASELPIPVYKDLLLKSKSLYSSVKVGSKKYSSYPEEAKSKDEAEILAAKVALKELTKDSEKTITVTCNRALVTNRIVQIVNAHPSGLFESCLTEMYIEKYKEGLPKDWLKLVEHLVNVDEGTNNFIILSSAIYNANIKAPPTKRFEPEKIDLTDMEEFWLHVYRVIDTTNIWGLIMDENHSDKVHDLAQEMKVHYDVERSKASTVTPGEYYAVFDSEWHRVRCVKFDEATETATVFFIDRGDEDVSSMSGLRVLHQKFCTLPAQAVRLSLNGFEVFENCQKTQTLLEQFLLDSSVYARIIRHSDRVNLIRPAHALSAELFLEQDGVEIYVNHLIGNEILSKIVNPLAFLGLNKLAQEVHISYIDEDAIFIQLKSEGMKLLKILINDLSEKHLTSSELMHVLNLDPSKMYIANIQNEWQRVRIVKIEDKDTVRVQCVDVGNTLTLRKSKLVLLEELSEILAVYPEQAVQVHLHKISSLMFNEKIAMHLRDLATKTDVIHVKVVDSHQNISIVEFYNRINNTEASLNDTLVLEAEMMSSRDKVFDSHSEFPLKAPAVPPIGSVFEVCVTMAAHPSNFKIQIFKNLVELEKFTKELSSYCKSYSGSFVMPSSIKVGSMYATKYDNSDRWYRVYVSKILNKIVSVYFCDYGDYKVMPINQLLPLKSSFYNLPYQAIKATLYGVMPKLNGDWTESDLYRFNELIAEKIFFATIKSCETESTSGELILGLELIDRSSQREISVKNVLISENRADEQLVM